MPVLGFPGYKAGSDGHIYSYKIRKRIDETIVPKRLKPGKGKTAPYLFVGLRKNGKTHNKAVHKIVCEAFHGPCPDGLETSHKNGNRDVNNPENLFWETHKNNLNRRVEHGTDDRGSNNSRALFTIKQIKQIKKLIKARIPYKEIAAQMGCSRRTIGNINCKRRYANQ